MLHFRSIGKGVSKDICCRWKHKISDMESSDIKKLKELENAKFMP